MNTRLEQLRQRTNPYYGLSMVKGEKGDKGDVGPQGPIGKTGPQGEFVQGPKGNDGKDGRNGRNGVDGLNGKDGKAGKDGKDGTTPEIQQVIDAVLKQLSKGKALKVEHVDGLTGSLKQLRDHLKAGGFRGGGDTVLAGSNITVVANGDGSKTISSSGGSGFTTLTATETPNGVLTVFTFALASAKPSFILSDGVWMEDTAQDSTVNWTWNNGTKKATMTIPPASAIKGIV